VRDTIIELLRKHLRFIKPSGPDNIGGPCPFHKGGMEKNPSFYMNTSNGMFFCHSCGARGGLATFLRKIGTRSEEIDQIVRGMPKETRRARDRRLLRQDVGKTSHPLNEGLLGVFGYCPTDLLEDGFDEQLLRELEIGFDNNQMRIIYPIRDLFGTLACLAGRSVTGEEPRYKVYKSEDILPYAPDDPDTQARYKAYEPKNRSFLWQMDKVYPTIFFGDEDTLIIVEGYKACMWLMQAEIRNVVALQGSQITWPQERVLSRFLINVILLLDNNDAGKRGTYRTGDRLIRKGHYVYVAEYPDWCESSAQPDDLDKDTIYEMLDNVKSFRDWRRTCPTTLR